jgi:thioredoxin 1
MIIRKIFYLSVATLLLMTACNSKQAENVQNNGQTETDNASSEPQKLSEQDFANKIADKNPNGGWTFKVKKPTLIDFFATWCGPCKMMSPNVDAMAKKYGGKIEVYKIDVDECENIARDFGIVSIPTLLFITPDGKASLSHGYEEMDDLESDINSKLLR